MTSRSVNLAVAAYLDTCVISGYVKNELETGNQSAFETILTAYLSKKIDLLRSAIVEMEIAAIPECYRTPHQTLLSNLLSIPVPSVSGLTRLGSGMFSMANPKRLLRQRLSVVLPDENDQQHIFVAACNRVHFFITVDNRTILSRRLKVYEACGVHAVTPVEFITHISSPMKAAQHLIQPDWQ